MPSGQTNVSYHITSCLGRDKYVNEMHSPVFIKYKTLYFLSLVKAKLNLNIKVSAKVPQCDLGNVGTIK